MSHIKGLLMVILQLTVWQNIILPNVGEYLYIVARVTCGARGDDVPPGEAIEKVCL